MTNLDSPDAGAELGVGVMDTMCEECAATGVPFYRTSVDLRLLCADCLAEYCGATKIEESNAIMTNLDSPDSPSGAA